jgi:hypothetical protein
MAVTTGLFHHFPEVGFRITNHLGQAGDQLIDLCFQLLVFLLVEFRLEPLHSELLKLGDFKKHYGI